MARKEIKTLEEYFQRREKLIKLHTVCNILFPLIMACLVLILFTWDHGLLRNYDIAWYGTAAIIFVCLAKLISTPKDIFAKGQHPDFYPLWLSRCYKNLPQEVKNIVERSCAKHPNTAPEDELLRIANNLNRISYIFLVIALGFVLYQFYVIFENELSLGALDYYNNAVDVFNNL